MRMRYFTTPFGFLLLLLGAALSSQAKPCTIPFVQTKVDSVPRKDTVGIDEQAFIKVDEEASFPGGTAGWIAFLEENLKADIPVRKKAPVGQYMVVVQFIVDQKGALSDIKALTAHGYGMEQEVIRVLKKSPKWLPAQVNGRKVKAYRKQPITFAVSDK